MAKKRNCRLTPEEADIHAQAVRLRKMTDAQLVEEVRNATAPRSSLPAGAESSQICAEDAGKADTPWPVETLLSALVDGRCKGIGDATICKIRMLARGMGLAR